MRSVLGALTVEALAAPAVRRRGVRRRARRAGLALATTLVLTGCSSTGGDAGARTSGSPTTPGPSTTDDSPRPHAVTIGALARRAREQVDAYRSAAPGVIVLVREGGSSRVVTAGVTDTRSDRRLSRSSTFPVESITKSMVATAVMQDVAAGRLGLSDTVEHWLPGLVRGGDRMTVRQLLSHRSGIHELTPRELPPLRTLDDSKILRIAGAHRPDFPPGTDGAYSNVGYTVLGMILQKVSGHPLADVLSTQVFRPSGMTHTSLAPAHWDVHGYFHDRDATDQEFLNIVQAAGGVVSTVDDVDAFYRHLWAGDLLPLSYVRLMRRPTGTVPFANGGYGLGIWIQDNLSCGTAYGHSGLSAGFVTAAWTVPRTDRTVVVMVSSGDDVDVAWHIAAPLLC